MGGVGGWMVGYDWFFRGGRPPPSTPPFPPPQRYSEQEHEAALAKAQERLSSHLGLQLERGAGSEQRWGYRGWLRSHEGLFGDYDRHLTKVGVSSNQDQSFDFETDVSSLMPGPEF